MIEPRWLDLTAAAAYLSVRADRLMVLVKEGRVPAPSYALGPRQPRWDRLALDAKFDGGVDSTNIDMVVQAICDDIAAGRDGRRRKKPPGE